MAISSPRAAEQRPRHVLSKARATALLQELLAGYREENFQRNLKALVEAAGSQDLEYIPGRLELTSTVQKEVLPRYGFEGDEAGLVQMSAAFKPMMEDPSLAAQVQEIHRALQIPTKKVPTTILELPAEIKMRTAKKVQSTPASQAETHKEPKALEKPQEKPQAKEKKITQRRAVALQNELLAAYSAPRFQKKLNELRRNCSGLPSSEFRRFLKDLVRSAQAEILPRYGFDATDEGLHVLATAMAPLMTDPNVLLLSTSVDEVLYGKPDPQDIRNALEKCDEPMIGWRTVVVFFLREQLAQVATEEVQRKVANLKQLAGCGPEDDCFRLPGRDELAVNVQKQILENYGFDGNRRGVQAMITKCAENVHDPEVAVLMDGVNAGLGMSPADCKRFRERCAPRIPKEAIKAEAPEAAPLPAPKEVQLEETRSCSCVNRPQQSLTTEQKVEQPQEEPEPNAELPQEEDERDSKKAKKVDVSLPEYEASRDDTVYEETIYDADLSPTSAPVLTKTPAIALQQELLAAYSAPEFQKKLNELRRTKNLPNSNFDFEFAALLRSVQLQIIPKYGFRPTVQGAKDMSNAFSRLQEDLDITVLDAAIHEALQDPADLLAQKNLRNSLPRGQSELTRIGVMAILRTQLTAFSTPAFQRAITQLKKAEGAAADGYHLPGRVELALCVQRQILPRFGFEGSREGVQAMIKCCARYIRDPEVAQLIDATNRKLGMSQSACQRFRALLDSSAGNMTQGQKVDGEYAEHVEPAKVV